MVENKLVGGDHYRDLRFVKAVNLNCTFNLRADECGAPLGVL